MHPTRLSIVAFALLAASYALWACATEPVRSGSTVSMDDLVARTAHADRVSRASYCATCHPDATAEHRQNTHGRAFTDEEVRLATARFSIDGCIACHTPRPIFETGIGMNPKKRLSHLEEGNDCFSCHARKDFDPSTFVGGRAECRDAFDERVGSVEACASCHKNHGTPYQWENAEHGKLAGNECIDCHMPKVVRPVAVGEEPRETRRHTFFASRSDSQLRRAYAYRARIDGNEVVVSIENKGAGHNFPTELKQRAVESVVTVRDFAGAIVATSRQIHRDPYKRPYGLTLPVNTQIPSGATREHRVPLGVSAGSVECELYYKLYYPIEDQHPTLSRRLEQRTLEFENVTPSTKPVESAPELDAHLPAALPVEAASPGNLIDFARPAIGKVAVDIPDGSRPEDVDKLIALFQFPVGEANRKAQDTLVALGERAVPGLVTALGSWDGKTWTQAKNVLGRMGDVGRRAVVGALSHDELYVRLHALEALPKFGDLGADRADAIEALKRGLSAEDALVRAGCAQALGQLRENDSAPLLRPLLSELDFDVVANAARALAQLNDRDALPALREHFRRMQPSAETARDLAWSLAALGDAHGIPFLLDGLSHPDDLVRESFFEAWLDVTGVSRAYTPQLGPEQRLEALGDLRAWWSVSGGVAALRTPRSTTISGKLRAEVEKLVKDLGGDDLHASTPAADETILARLRELGKAATPMVVDGLKWPSGFSDKRAGLLRALAASPDSDALAAMIDASRDPVPAVALWAVEGLGALGNPSGREAAREVEQRMEGMIRAGTLPESLGSPDTVRAICARARARMGDANGGHTLLGLLSSLDIAARSIAEPALTELYGQARAGEDTVAFEARRALQSLPEIHARTLARLQADFDSRIAAAEAAGERAKTTAERLAALELYDFAEASTTRYAAQDPRASGQDFDRARAGSDDLAALLGRDNAWIESRPWIDALAPSARGQWNYDEKLASSIEFGAQGLSATLPGDPRTASSESASLHFGAAQAWRDYEVELTLRVDAGSLTILDRASLEAKLGGQLAVVVDDAVLEPATMVHARVAAGGGGTLHQRVIGGLIERRADKDLAPLAGTQPAPASLRAGGIVLRLSPGTRLSIESLRVRPLRSDATLAAQR